MISEKRLKWYGLGLTIVTNIFIVWFMWHRWKTGQDLLIPIILLLVLKIRINQYLQEQKVENLIQLLNKAAKPRSRKIT
jgi:hypothetical protein